MSRLMDAAVRLYHKRSKEQINNFFNAFESGDSFKNNNYCEIWFWAIERWNDFPEREYKLRGK